MLRNVVAVVVLMRKELSDIEAAIPGNKGRLDDNNAVARQAADWQPWRLSGERRARRACRHRDESRLRAVIRF